MSSNAIQTLKATHVFIRPHCPWRNGRWSATTAPCKPSGRPAGLHQPTPPAPRRWRPGCTCTTPDTDTQPLEGNPTS